MTRPTRPESDLTPFGRWLLDRLEERSMSRADLMRAANTTSTAVSGWLYGKTPRIGSCVTIASALHLPLEEVLVEAGHLPRAVATTESLLRQEAINQLYRMPEQLLITVTPMLRGLADQAQPTLQRLHEATDRE